MADVVKNFVRLGKSSSTTKYSPLAQEPSDEEEEDDILYIHDSLRENGFTRINITQSNGKSDTIELNNLGARPYPNTDVEVTQRKPWGRRKRAVFTTTVIFSLSLILFSLIFFPWKDFFYGSASNILGNVNSTSYVTNSSLNDTDVDSDATLVPEGSRPTHDHTDQWMLNLKGYASESCVRLVDVDEDGKDDIIMGVGLGVDFNDFAQTQDTDALCRQLGLAPPCLGRVLAIRGNDSHVLWNISISAAPFLFSCDSIDINKDGMKDCIGAGRMGALVAFNPKNGDIFYTEASLGDYMNRAWNIYQPLVLDQDLDGDAVNEVVIAHGGEPRFSSEVHNRNPGRLILLSGATGVPVGRYLNMPNKKETYMSPVLHKTGDNTQYILFGSGGETVSGAFMAISVENLYGYVRQNKTNQKPWGSLVPDEKGIIEIHKTKLKGMMVPPTLVEMTGDGVLDILMISFEGSVILFDGNTLLTIWQINLNGYESYSTPAPGHFNDDNVLDFMMHWSPGTWPHYSYSVTMVVDGRDGSILWQMPSSHYEMSSDLVLRTNDSNRDVFLFRVQGREGPNYENPSGEFHDVIPQRPLYYGRRKRHAHQTARRRRIPPDQLYPEGKPQNILSHAHIPLGQRPNPNGKNQNPQRGQYSSGRGSQQNIPPNSGQQPGFKHRGQPVPYRNFGPGYSGSWPRQRRPHFPNNLEGGRRRRPYMYNQRHRHYPPVGPSPTFSSSRRQMDPGSGYGQGSPGAGADWKQGQGSGMNEEQARKEEEALRHRAATECSRDKRSYRMEVFAMDRTTMKNPVRVASMDMYTLTYNLTEVDKKAYYGDLVDDPEIDLKEQPFNFGPFCSVISPTETTTGAIGDLDGDGTLDLALIIVHKGFIHTEDGSYLRMVFDLKIKKINLEQLIRSPTHFNVNATIKSTVSQKSNVNISDLRFLHMKNQPWAAYMGTQGDGAYRIQT